MGYGERAIELPERKHRPYGVIYEEDSRSSAAVGGLPNAVGKSPQSLRIGEGDGVQDYRRRYLQDPNYQVSAEISRGDNRGSDAERKRKRWKQRKGGKRR